MKSREDSSANLIPPSLVTVDNLWISILIFSLNIMLRVFSTPAHESSQFILKLQFSDPRRVPGKLLLLLVPLHTETPIKQYILFRGT